MHKDLHKLLSNYCSVFLLVSGFAVTLIRLANLSAA